MKHKKLLAIILALALCVGLLPTAFAAQENGYHDPAEHWLTANNRTNELDANAVVTQETFKCAVCNKITSFTIWRTPEYTKDGQTALTRNVLYSDGTMVDGEGTGVILDGTPGVDAAYTHYHWTKAMCNTCGTMNSNGGLTGYGFNKNVYNLYDCAAEFMESLPETVSYAYADSKYHTKTTTGGEYCCFCFGTEHTEKSVLERHDLRTEVLPQPANGRFAIVEGCTLCDYTRYEYVAAKAVVADYYGTVDGAPHTIAVTDLSESGVRTAIRYGSSANACTLTSAPNYIEEGQYTVYYEITYTYDGVEMTENGAAYIWLRDENTIEGGSCACGCGDPDCGCQGKNCGGSCCNQPCDNHSFVLLDSIPASCQTLGYDRYLCTNCGRIEKRDYEAALGHAWQGVTIREADCETDGKLLNLCSRCGQMEVTATAKSEHDYETYSVAATCTSPGYTVKECAVCGDRHITDITSALAHEYKSTTIPASCETGGMTVHRCEGCGSSFVTDYTDALGHSWDNGTKITGATCTGEGVTEYRCTRCGYHRLDGVDANGHIPDHDATCTEPSTCTACGAVLKPASGHKESDWIIDKEPTAASEGSKHKACEICGETLETQTIERIYNQATTDSRGEAVVGGYYLVTVIDTDTTNPVAGAAVMLNKDNSLSILLPSGRLLNYDDQTTVTVQLVKDKSAVSDMSIAVTDKNGNYAAGTTDRAGQITVPGTSGKTNSDGRATAGYEDADGDRWTLTVKVEDYETGRPIEDAGVSVGKTGKLTVTLPDGVDMDEDNRITVTVTDHRKEPQEGLQVTVKGDLGQRETGETGKDGKLTVPAVAENEYHSAYIVGYPDGSFGPERSMTRSEAAAIFARILSAQKNETIRASAQTRFDDIPENAWYAGYVHYLSDYGIAYGRGSNIFAPDAAITRAEFTVMAVRLFEVLGSGNAEIMEQYAPFSDVGSGHWAAEYIRDAAVYGWIIGYGDGSFAPDAEITRAEVVTLMNRLLGRGDCDAVTGRGSAKVKIFTDMTSRHWAYEDVLEAANGHWSNDWKNR